MVKVKIFRHEHHIDGFEIKGHAMHRRTPDEFDLVCAGISSISISALNGLHEYLKLELVNPECSDGYIYCRLPVSITEVQDLKAQAILETMVLGLKEIAKDFPQHIKFV